jgi:hypothetical protein
MPRIDLTWLSKLTVGDSVLLTHSFLYPKGRRRRVTAVTKRKLTLEDKTEVSLVTGDVMKGGTPNCYGVYPWVEPVVSAADKAPPAIR